MEKSYFYQVPDKLMCRTDLTYADKLLYAIIKRLKVCFASNKRLAEMLGGNEKTIRRSLDRLKETGLIRQLPNQGHRTCYEVVGQNVQVNVDKKSTLVGQNVQVNVDKKSGVNRDLMREDNKRVSERDTRTLDMNLEKVRKFQSLWSLSIGASQTILDQLSSVLPSESLGRYLDFVLDEDNFDKVKKTMVVAENERRNIDYFLADNIDRLRNAK